MSEMLTRVTEAVRAAEKAWWDSDEEPEIPLAEVLARAAIAATREPTKEMVQAAYAYETGEAPEVIYHAMIDAALT